MARSLLHLSLGQIGPISPIGLVTHTFLATRLGPLSASSVASGMATDTSGRADASLGDAISRPTHTDTPNLTHVAESTLTMDMTMDPATWDQDASIVKATTNQDAPSLSSLSFTGPSTTTFSLSASPLPAKSTEPRPRSNASASATAAAPTPVQQATRALPMPPVTPPEPEADEKAKTEGSFTHSPTAMENKSPPECLGPATNEPRSQEATPQKDSEPSTREDDSDGDETEDTPDEEPTQDADTGEGTEQHEVDVSGAADEEGSGSPAQPGRKRPRSPSPFDPYTSQPPPRPTLRLQFSLTHTPRHKSDYIFRIPRLAVDQLSEAYPEWTSWYRAMYLEGDMAKSSREVGLSAEELHDLGGLARLLHKYPTQGPATHLSRKRRVDEYDVGSYDTKDPFVDDSELGIDEPTHVVRTQADGFYVAKGQVALACAKASTMESSRSASAFRSSLGADVGRGWVAGTNKLLAKRAASRKLQQSSPTPRAPSMPDSSMDSPATMPMPPAATSNANETPDTAPAAPPAAAAAPADEVSSDRSDAKNRTAEKRKNKYPTVPVHPQLQAMFDHLKQLVSKASFAVKTKFPPELKPPLIETAKVAVELDEYNDNFFNYLPSIFPYNRFTMMKLTKREFFHKHMEYFRELQEEHLDRLGKMIDESFPTQLAEYEALCRERGVEGKDNEEGGMDEDGETTVDETRLQMDADDTTKRFRWSDDMRDELFTIVTVENAMSEIRNEKLYAG